MQGKSEIFWSLAVVPIPNAGEKLGIILIFGIFLVNLLQKRQINLFILIFFSNFAAFLINESNYSLCKHDFGSIPYIFAKLNSEAINAQGNKREAIKVYVGNELAAIAEPIDYS